MNEKECECCYCTLIDGEEILCDVCRTKRARNYKIAKNQTKLVD